MNNVEKKSGCISFLNLADYRYVMLYNEDKLSGSLSSQNIENQQITSAKYTTLMLGVRQNEHNKAFGGFPPYQE